MSGERSALEGIENGSRLGVALSGFSERAARSIQERSDTGLWLLLREMILFRSEEAMTWKNPADLAHWNRLNELIRLVHGAVESTSRN